VLQALAQGGAPLNAVESATGRTALHLLAARSGSAAAINMLLQCGANAYIADRLEGGQTPLGCALAAGNTSAVELLLLPGSRRRTDGSALSPYPSAPPLQGSLQQPLQRSHSTAPAAMLPPRALAPRPRHAHTKSM
jgi:ankyrin repeat protein